MTKAATDHITIPYAPSNCVTEIVTPVLALHTQWCEAVERLNAADGDLEIDRCSVAPALLACRMATTPAAGPVDILAKLRVLAREAEHETGEETHALLASIMADANRIIGHQAVPETPSEPTLPAARKRLLARANAAARERGAKWKRSTLDDMRALELDEMPDSQVRMFIKRARDDADAPAEPANSPKRQLALEAARLASLKYGYRRATRLLDAMGYPHFLDMPDKALRAFVARLPSLAAG